MNDDMPVQHVLDRCRLLEQVVFLLAQHVSGRPGTSGRLAGQALRSAEERAVATGYPATTCAALRRASLAFPADRRSRPVPGASKPVRRSPVLRSVQASE